MRVRKGVVGVVFALGGCLAACGEDAVVPEVQGGAGLRFTFPAGADSLDWVRVELWHRNDVLPPGCDPAAASNAHRAPATPFGFAVEPDTCGHFSVLIRNLIGEPVRSEDSIPFVNSLAWGWDTLDDAGRPVPSGYYTVFSQCLDSRGSFTFKGHYYVLQDRERGSCDWPLWIREISPAPAARTLSVAPFPEVAQTWLLDEFGWPQELVNFQNPFLVRVRAPGMETFEAEVVLREGSFTEVAVAWTPAAAVGAEVP